MSATSGQTAIKSATITGWMIREEHFCAQVSLCPLSGIRSVNVLWSTVSTEKSECLCLRAYENSELESGLWMIPAPGWRTESLLECRYLWENCLKKNLQTLQHIIFISPATQLLFIKILIAISNVKKVTALNSISSFWFATGLGFWLFFVWLVWIF